MPAPFDASQHDTANCPARKRWLAAAAAASLIYRAHDARTATHTSNLLIIAGVRLREAGLRDLAWRANDLGGNFAAPLQAVRELQAAVAEAAGKLEAAYLEMCNGVC
jgi:hypothetical protein